MKKNLAYLGNEYCVNFGAAWFNLKGLLGLGGGHSSFSIASNILI